MFKIILKLLLGSALLVALPACALSGPAPATLDPNAINTAIAQTMLAASTQTSEAGIPITGPETATPTVTIIATEALSPTAAFTATPAITQVSVSVATNCRAGPGLAYPRVGGLLVGQVAEVVGRNSDSTYWIIRNPIRPSELCWLWGQFATIIGDTGGLAVMTPPPAPLPTATPSPTLTLTAAFTPTTPPTPTPSPTPTSTP